MNAHGIFAKAEPRPAVYQEEGPDDDVEDDLEVARLSGIEHTRSLYEGPAIVQIKGYRREAGYVRPVRPGWGFEGVELTTFPASAVRCDSAQNWDAPCSRCKAKAQECCSQERLTRPVRVQNFPGSVIYSLEPCARKEMEEVIREEIENNQPAPADTIAAPPPPDRIGELCKEIVFGLVYRPEGLFTAIASMAGDGGLVAQSDLFGTLREIRSRQADPFAHTSNAEAATQILDHLEEIAERLDDMPF